MAGALRAEATLALANGLFIAFLLLGGIVVPVADLPGPLATLAGLLPAAALADAFRVALGIGATRSTSVAALAILLSGGRRGRAGAAHVPLGVTPAERD